MCINEKIFKTSMHISKGDAFIGRTKIKLLLKRMKKNYTCHSSSKQNKRNKRKVSIKLNIT